MNVACDHNLTGPAHLILARVDDAAAAAAAAAVGGGGDEAGVKTDAGDGGDEDEEEDERVVLHFHGMDGTIPLDDDGELAMACSDGMGMPANQDYYGPSIWAAVAMPVPGTYKVFISVNRSNAGLVTPSYAITVAPAPPPLSGATQAEHENEQAKAKASAKGKGEGGGKERVLFESQMALCAAASAGEIRAAGGATSSAGNLGWMLGGGTQTMEYLRLALLVVTVALILLKFVYRPSWWLRKRRSVRDLLGRVPSIALLDITGKKEDGRSVSVSVSGSSRSNGTSSTAASHPTSLSLSPSSAAAVAESSAGSMRARSPRSPKTSPRPPHAGSSRYPGSLLRERGTSDSCAENP